MTTQHTPGPWHVGRRTEFRNQIAIEPTIGCVYGDIEHSETKANAHIFAAGPELLEACIAADLILSLPIHGRDYDEIKNMLKDVIAKAKP